MKSLSRPLLLLLALPTVAACYATPARAIEAVNAVTQGFDEGRWRVELGAATAFHSGRRDRGGDVVMKGSVEYEWPVYARWTAGLRAYPLFVYLQDDPEATLWGGGVGVAGRVYQHKDSRHGFFGEGGVGVLFHSNHIEGNSASLDFLLEGGVGYRFPKSDWHVALQVQHISNGGLSDDNAGANSVGLAVGYTF